MCLKHVQKFLRAREANVAVIFGLATIPIVLGAGLAVDYSHAVNVRSSMQDALDAGLISAAKLDIKTSFDVRQAELTKMYEQNGGLGTATLTLSITNALQEYSASATFDLPTNFMRLANVNYSTIEVKNRVFKTLRPTTAKFKLDKVTGWWDKTVTLYGKKYGSTEYVPLMMITYKWNGIQSNDNVGTTTIYQFDQNFDAATEKKKGGVIANAIGTLESAAASTMTATTLVDAVLGGGGSAPVGGAKLELTKVAGKVVSVLKKSQKTCLKANGTASGNLSDCKVTSGDDGAVDVPLQTMDDIYVQMDILPKAEQGFQAAKDLLKTSTPLTFKSNDTAYSDRLFIKNKQTAKGQKVDIFGAIGCDEQKSHAWEDGGGYDKQDLFYDVVGKCDPNDPTFNKIVFTK